MGRLFLNHQVFWYDFFQMCLVEFLKYVVILVRNNIYNFFHFFIEITCLCVKEVVLLLKLCFFNHLSFSSISACPFVANRDNLLIIILEVLKGFFLFERGVVRLTYTNFKTVYDFSK